MFTSVIIPVWNGASTILQCIETLKANTKEQAYEIICVDNASTDESAALIRQHEDVRLIEQSVNLGFAGGVNAGIDAAQGDLLLLLNQDCLVEPKWLESICHAFQQNPRIGIAGCTILNPDGSVNHAGAMIRHPNAYGIHITEQDDKKNQNVDYVTGAVFAIRRQMQEDIGALDDGFYPAYYEESDYCYRARHNGWAVVYVPTSYARHLFSSQEWQQNPTKHTVDQHRSRYRFVIKHFNERELQAFFLSEQETIQGEYYLDQLNGRVVAARQTLRTLDEILARRQTDLGRSTSDAHRRHIEVGFTQIYRMAFAEAQTRTQDWWRENSAQPDENDPVNLTNILTELEAPVDEEGKYDALSNQVKTEQDILQSYQAKEYQLLEQIFFKKLSNTSIQEPILRKLWRLCVLRPFSFFTGREHRLLSELNTLHVLRIDHMERLLNSHTLAHEAQNQAQQRAFQAYHRASQQAYQRIYQQEIAPLKDQIKLQEERINLLESRLNIIETVTDYDYS